MLSTYRKSKQKKHFMGTFELNSEVSICYSKDFDLRKQKNLECQSVRMDHVRFLSTANKEA